MIGRENQQANNLFFTCSLIEYIARKTKNKRSDTVDGLGRVAIEKIYVMCMIWQIFITVIILKPSVTISLRNRVL